MRNLRYPWVGVGARPRLKMGHDRPLWNWWQSVLRNREIARQLRRRDKKLQLLGLLDLAKDRAEARMRAIEAFRSKVQSSMEEPVSRSRPYDVEDPGQELQEPFDTSIPSEPHEYSEAYDYEGDEDYGTSTRTAKPAKKRTTKKRSTKKKR